MLQEANSEGLLYVSNGGNDTISVYSYRNGRLVGTLTGFGLPWGLCSDKAGAVFVTDWSKGQVIEYKHGGSEPVRTLDDAPYSPVDCSFDPLTGDLAVASISRQGSGSYPSGSIAVYKKAEGTPKVYTTPRNSHFVACTYDDMGNLFADAFGYSYGAPFQMYELVRHKNGLRRLHFRPHLSASVAPDGLQWDGKYVIMAVTNNTINQYSVGNGFLKQEGSTELSGQGVNLGLFWVGKLNESSQATQLVALGSNEAQYYAYPAGGTPTRSITNGLDDPFGVTVSFSKHGH